MSSPDPQRLLDAWLETGGILFDGVRLLTRSGEPQYDALIRRVEAVADAYEVPACQTLTRIYVDDRNEAHYEVELAKDIPPGLDQQIAEEVRDLFRELGGQRRRPAGRKRLPAPDVARCPGLYRRAANDRPKPGDDGTERGITSAASGPQSTRTA
jgi:hypothetical protein